MIRHHLAAACGLACLALGGCRPPEAPTELSDLGAFLFRNFEAEDPQWLQAGMQNLHALFSTADLSVDYESRAFSLVPLTEDDLADMDRPDNDPALAGGISLAGSSAFPPADHATLIVLPDQTPISPSSPEQYARTFLDPTDAGCFPTQQCDLLRTWNDFIKENTLMSIHCLMNKDYRWVEVFPDEGEWGILGRSWFPTEAVGDGGQNTIHQSHSVDAFLPDAGGSIHFQVIWSQTTAPGLSDDTIAALVKYGLHQSFEATEEVLAEGGS